MKPWMCVDSAKESELIHEEMLFENPAFHPGLNITVRNGKKWSEKKLDAVRVVKTGDTELLGVLSVVFQVELNLARTRSMGLLTKIIQHEHDPNCRTLEGLCKVMDEVYGEWGWGPIVTVVGLWNEIPPEQKKSGAEGATAVLLSALHTEGELQKQFLIEHALKVLGGAEFVERSKEVNPWPDGVDPSEAYEYVAETKGGLPPRYLDELKARAAKAAEEQP